MVYLFLDSSLPTLSWFLKEIIDGAGADLCPLISVCEPGGDSGGNSVVLSRDQKASHYLCSYQDKEGNTIVSKHTSFPKLLFCSLDYSKEDK